jgi:hypothetical protein
MKQKEIDRRHKTCKICGIKYCDTTKRYVGKTCSKTCAKTYSVQSRRAKGSYKRTAEANAKMVATIRERYGSFSALYTEEVRKKSSKANKLANADGSVQEKIRKTNLERYGVENVFQADEIKESIRKTCIEKYGVDHWMKSDAGRNWASQHGKAVQDRYSSEERSRRAKEHWKKTPINVRNQITFFGNGGKRIDLDGQYFRSNWEANIARIMNLLSLKWEYEPIAHEFCDGTVYFPDFRVFLPSGKQMFIEVKGYKDEDGMLKWQRFCKNMANYDKIVCHLIDSEAYNKFRKMFKNMKNFNWEGR